MHRCLQLANLGRGKVAPNPMVGAVLVYENTIIGEGYHQLYGAAHAEVNCINSVRSEHYPLIAKSTLYVSLEPCAHFGKTPPCADLIIKYKIPCVVIGCRDPFVEVNGRGIEKLKNAGIKVVVGVLEEECKDLNKRFFLFHKENRPYVILKWAQTGDAKMAAPSGFQQEVFSKNTNSKVNEANARVPAQRNGGAPRLLISNPHTNRVVHRWRSEEMAILVGTNTAFYDDPELTTRLWPGENPIRIVVDMDLKLPKSLRLFNGKTPTVVFNLHQHNLPFEKISARELAAIGVGYWQVTEDVSLVHQMANALKRMNIQSVMVEGGARLLQSFVDEGIWDEARIITNDQLIIGSGLPSPTLKNHSLINTETIFTDTIRIYHQLPK